MKTVLADASTVFVLENCGLSDKLAVSRQVCHAAARGIAGTWNST